MAVLRSRQVGGDSAIPSAFVGRKMGRPIVGISGDGITEVLSVDVGVNSL
jgi:hypothetical protein